MALERMQLQRPTGAFETVPNRRRAHSAITVVSTQELILNETFAVPSPPAGHHSLTFLQKSRGNGLVKLPRADVEVRSAFSGRTIIMFQSISRHPHQLKKKRYNAA
jgi:hypothetical protein